MPRRRSRSRSRSPSSSRSSRSSRSRSTSRPDRSYSRSASASPPKGDNTGRTLKYLGIIAATAAIAHWAWPRGVINGEDIDWKAEIARMRDEKRRAGRALAAGGHAFEVGGRAVRDEWDQEREGRHITRDRDRERWERDRERWERERYERERGRWMMKRERERRWEEELERERGRPRHRAELDWDPQRERERNARNLLSPRSRLPPPPQRELELVWDGRGRGMVIEPDGSSRPLRDREADLLVRHECERGRGPPGPPAPEDYLPRGRSRTRYDDYDNRRLPPPVPVVDDDWARGREVVQPDPLGIYDARRPPP